MRPEAALNAPWRSDLGWARKKSKELNWEREHSDCSGWAITYTAGQVDHPFFVLGTPWGLEKWELLWCSKYDTNFQVFSFSFFPSFSLIFLLFLLYFFSLSHFFSYIHSDTLRYY
jgi:hypothetical protein